MSRVLTSPSLWALAAAIVLFLLQLLPIPGVFLMMFGAGLITVLLIHVFLIGLFVEGATGRLPRFLMIVPVVAYGAYYAAYWQEGREIAERAAALRAENPGKVFDFDPEIHSLVGKDAGRFVQTHDIPVVYEPSPNYKPENYLSFRLIRRDQCDAIKQGIQGRVTTLGVLMNGQLLRSVCLLQFPDDPTKEIVIVSADDPEIWKCNPGVTEFVTEIKVDGKVMGSYRSAVVWRLPVLPMGFIGCGLVSSKPAWECSAQFMRTFRTLDTIPDTVDKARYDTPESVMLGLRKYTAADLADFKGFAQNDAVMARIGEEPKRVENEAFDALQNILNGQVPKQLPFAMAYTLSRRPDRLAPLADGMARRFAELNDNRETRDGVAASVLQAALVSLQKQTFQGVARPIFEIVRNDRASDPYYAIWRIDIRRFTCEPRTRDRRHSLSTSRNS